MNTVIIKLMGGLASQMHKYAIGRTIADRHGCELKLDLSWYNSYGKGDTPRKFMLDQYRARYGIASYADVTSLKTPRLLLKASSLCRRLGMPCDYIRETHYVRGRSAHDVLECRPPVYIEGEWVGSRYLKEDEPRLREDFQLKQSLGTEAGHLLHTIQQGASVAVHIRRGDFVHGATASKFHYVLGMDYYMSALEAMRSRVPGATFYVFSDDYAWVRDNLRTLGNDLVFVPEHAPPEDLQLMSCCGHQVIANSGFSWFSAWLNKSPGKIMLAPTNWVRDEALNEEIVADLKAYGFEMIYGHY